MKKIIFLLLFLAFFTTSVSANTSVKEIERKFSEEFGIVFELVETGEENLITPSLQPYFKPSSNSNYLIETANNIYGPLKMYNKDILKSMNLTIHIVEPNNMMSAGMASYSSDKDYCKITIAAHDTWVEGSEKRTLHHELFHCYDMHGIGDEYSTLFTPSPYVMQGWDLFGSDITVDLYREDRAVYFSSIMENYFNQLDGTRSKYQRDPQINEKIKYMQTYVDYFTKPNEVIEEPVNEVVVQTPIKEGIVRTWKGGQISKIEIYEDYIVKTTYEFYADGSYSVLENNY